MQTTLLARQRLFLFAAFVFFLALAALQTWPLVWRLGDGLITLTQDGAPNTDISIFLWNFWWVKKALLELHQNPAFCDWLCRPGKPAFVFPTLSLQNCLVALPLLSVFSLETSYNILIWVILALTGWAACWLVLDMTGCRPAAIAAGLVFGTVPLHLRVASQLNVFTLFWIPLALLAGRRWLATARPAAAIALAAVCLLNMLAEWHHAVELAILVALLIVARIWQTRAPAVRRHDKTVRRAVPVALAIYLIGGQFNLVFHAFLFAALFAGMCAVLLASRESDAMQRLVRRLTQGAGAAALAMMPVVIPMYRAMQEQPWLRDTPLVAKAVFGADLAGYLMPGEWAARLFARPDWPDAYLYGVRTTGPSDVFPGYVAWAVFALAAWYWARRGRRGGEWLAIAAVFLALSLGPVLKFGGIVHWKINPAEHIILPAMIFEFVAVLQAIRVFLRFAFIAWLCMAVFVGLQAADWLAGMQGPAARRKATGALAVCAALLVAERLDLPQPMGRIPASPALEWLRSQPPATVLMYPMVYNQYLNLYAQTVHNQPMVNPYVSRRPEDILEYAATNPFLRWFTNMKRLQAGINSVPELQTLRAGWFRLDAKWLVVDRSQYQSATFDRIHYYIQQVLAMRIVQSDDRYVIYE
ncbi:MAG: hypothetical protein N3D11_08005 [Candidatus Sumerlaeia bacterium]|nr:hypothetical protein [Candidatus Sumerlaeia bacterium]